MDTGKLSRLFEEHALKYKVALNPDKAIVGQIVERLLANDEKYGHKFCPCRPPSGDIEKDRLIICPCVYHLDEVRLSGKCLCQLFVKNIKIR